MNRFDPGEDAFVLATFVALLVLLTAGLTGMYALFACALVTLLGVFIGRGLLRRAAPATWVACGLAVGVLIVATWGILRYEDAIVDDPADTVLGFQTGTAFLIYGLWLPSLVTLGGGFAVLFDRLAARQDGTR